MSHRLLERRDGNEVKRISSGTLLEGLDGIGWDWVLLRNDVDDES
jgi:hypothetical protein